MAGAPRSPGLIPRLALLAALALPAGCVWPAERPTTRPDDALAGHAVWQPHPVALRLHPTSGFVAQVGQMLLDLRLELLDDMGDSIKAPGRLRIELYDQQRPSEPAAGERFDIWEIPVLDLEQQRQYYDPVTRTYWFRLRVRDLPASRRSVLGVCTFIPPAGPRLETRGVLAVEPALPPERP